MRDLLGGSGGGDEAGDRGQLAILVHGKKLQEKCPVENVFSPTAWPDDDFFVHVHIP